jgi:hypothetical protein
MDHKRNAKYFKPKPSIKTMAIILVVGLVTATFTMGIGLIIAIAILVMCFVGRPSDQEIDNLANTLVNSLKQQALNKLGIDEDEVKIATPISFWGYDFGFVNERGVWKEPLNDEKIYKSCYPIGKDKYARSPIVRVSYFFFSDKEVHYYSMLCSLISDTYKEVTEVVSYKNVVSVKTLNEEMPLYNRKTGKEVPGEKARFDSFALRNSGGETISCTVRDAAMIENSIKAMRNLVKEKQG